MDEIWGLTRQPTTDGRCACQPAARTVKNCDDFIIMTVRGLGYKAVKTEA